ncbi:MAG: G5 domain-containing protein [Bacillota bacterium]
MRKVKLYAVIFVALIFLTGSAVAWWFCTEEAVAFSDNNSTRVIKTHASTVGALLAELNANWRPEDLIIPGPEARIREGMKVRIYKAEPFYVDIDGESFILWAVPGPAVEVLKKAGLQLGSNDQVLPSRNARVRRGARIVVKRAAREVRAVTEIIPLQVMKVEDHTLDAGETRIKQKGCDGMAETVYRYIYENGRYIKRIVLRQKVIKARVPTIIHYGLTSPWVRAELSSRGVRRWRVKTMVATAYYWGPECCGKEADGYTSLGLKATHGIVAVDPRVIPLRTRLYIEGYGFAIAGDVGGAIKRNRIDLCFDTYREALMYGCRKVKVYILE